ncbi:MAG: hypothetical protein CMJ78_20420 [Planctomycetaceae bacterium]|nr:hypothetical protein [Planctomycetaceae bacterium]
MVWWFFGFLAVVLAVLIALYLRADKAPAAATAAPKDLANLRVTDAQRGDVVELNGGGDDFSDLSFNMVAMGVIVLKASAGDLFDWTTKLEWFALDVILGFVLLMILRKVTDALFLPGTTISQEIANDKNTNAAWVEGVVATGIATIIFFVV